MNNEDTRKFLEQFKQDYIDGVNSDVDSIIEATECLLATGQWLPIHQGILQTIDELVELKDGHVLYGLYDLFFIHFVLHILTNTVF